MTDDASSKLWNDGVTATEYGTAGEKYQNAILEQYDREPSQLLTSRGSGPSEQTSPNDGMRSAEGPDGL
jgi:hypothetical protein